VGIMSRNRRAARAASVPGTAVCEPDAAVREFGREPELVEQRRAVDPYTAWLAQRDAEREQIRWVYRPESARSDELVGA